jgi:hypothetical protein
MVLKTIIRESVSGVRIPESPQNCLGGEIGRHAGLKILFAAMRVRVRFSPEALKKKNMLFIYYVICIIYCFYQLNNRYKKLGIEYSSPELDAIMVLVMAWVLAPIDVSLTWIRWYKEAEQARIDQSKIEINLSEEDIS